MDNTYHMLFTEGQITLIFSILSYPQILNEMHTKLSLGPLLACMIAWTCGHLGRLQPTILMPRSRAIGKYQC